MPEAFVDRATCPTARSRRAALPGALSPTSISSPRCSWRSPRVAASAALDGSRIVDPRPRRSACTATPPEPRRSPQRCAPHSATRASTSGRSHEPPDAATRAAPTFPRVLPTGDRALLVELDSLDDVLALHAELRHGRPSGVVDLVPAARTVLVTVDPEQLSLSEARCWVDRAARRRRTRRRSPWSRRIPSSSRALRRPRPRRAGRRARPASRPSSSRAIRPSTGVSRSAASLRASATS